MDEHPQTLGNPDSTLPGDDQLGSPLSTLPSRFPSSEGCATPFSSESEGSHSSDGDNDDSTPPRKRKNACPSSVAIPASVRATVIRKAGGKCWLCGLNGVHIGHVIASSETVLFSEYKLSGLLHMDSLNELQNLMYLCAGCHHTFYARVPIWAFLPINLDHFIAQESAFHIARVEAASLGLPLSRPDPCNGHIPVLRYGRYQIRPNYLHDINFLAQPIKRWVGNPIAAILRSAGIIAGVQRLDTATRGGLPEDVARKFHELLFLYGVPSPPVARLARTLDLVARDVRATAPEEMSPSPELPCDWDMTGAPRTDTTGDGPREALHGNGTRRGAGTNEGLGEQTLLTPSHSNLDVCKKRRIPDEMPTWVFGPKMTSNRLISWSMDSLELEAEDEACREKRRRKGGEVVREDA